MGRKISLLEGVFILLTAYGIFFLIYGLSHLSNILTSSGVGEKFWWVAKGLSAIIILVILYRSIRKYRGRVKESTPAVTKNDTSPPFFIPLMNGLVWPGLLVLIVVSMIATAIMPKVLQVPNMFIPAIVLTAIYYALRSAVVRSKASSVGRKEPHGGLVSMRQMVGGLALVMWFLFLPIYYTSYAPDALTTLIQTDKPSWGKRALLNYLAEKRGLGSSVDREDLPQNTLLEPGLEMNDVGKWTVKFNILNVHTLDEGIMSQESIDVLKNAANGYPLQIAAGSFINTNVNLSVAMTDETATVNDGIFLYNGNCLSPSRERNGMLFTPKTCTGNWRTLSNSIGGVYSITFKDGNVFIVDLFEGNMIKGFPDARLIAERKED